LLGRKPTGRVFKDRLTEVGRAGRLRLATTTDYRLAGGFVSRERISIIIEMYGIGSWHEPTVRGVAQVRPLPVEKLTYPIGRNDGDF